MSTARRLRVLHVCAAPEFARLILIHDLRRLSQYDHVVACADGPDLAPLRAAGIEVRTIPIERKIAPLRDLASLVALGRLFRSCAPDIVHTYTPKAGLLGQLAAWLGGRRVRVHSCRGLLYRSGLSAARRLLYRITDWTTFHLARTVVFVSGADRDLAVSSGLCPRNRSIHTGSGIDLRQFAPPDDPAAARRAIRERLGLPLDAQVLLTVGRFVVEKGYLELAQAAAALAETRPGLRFLWVAPVLTGEDDLVDSSILARPPLDRVVQRVERQEDMRSIYCAADLLVHPSWREGVSRTLMEASALGLPIVASDIPGNREVVDDRSARLFAPRDPAALRAAIEAALDDAGRTKDRAATARARAADRFDQDRVSARVAAVYAALANGAAA